VRTVEENLRAIGLLSLLAAATGVGVTALRMAASRQRKAPLEYVVQGKGSAQHAVSASYAIARPSLAMTRPPPARLQSPLVGSAAVAAERRVATTAANQVRNLSVLARVAAKPPALVAVAARSARCFGRLL